MTDNYSGKEFSDPQAENIKSREFAEKEKNESYFSYAELYDAGVKLINSSSNFLIELDSRGPFCRHSIFRKAKPKEVKGIYYPEEFKPYQPVVDPSQLVSIIHLLQAKGGEVWEFWKNLFEESTNNPLLNYVESKLKTKSLKDEMETFEPEDYKQTFDPANKIGNGSTNSPKIWVPDKDWFDEKIKSISFESIFSIFPKAECEMLKLILGRLAVGPNNHIPNGWNVPLTHTARMAGIIVG